MPYDKIEDNEIQAGAPLDELLLTKLRDNQEFFNSQAGSSGGGS